MKQYLKNKNKRNGLIGTIIFHLALLIIFFLTGLTYQYPPPEQGILINFGDSEQGLGEVQPEEPGEVVEEIQAEAVEEPVDATPEPSDVQEEPVMTQDAEEAIEVPKETEEERQKRIEEENKKKEQEEFKKKMEDVWKKKPTNQTGSSEGETGKPGDQGKEEGSKESTSHIGGPDDGGTSYNLRGRSMVVVPKIHDTSQEEGKVVVSIVVDRDGNIIKATPGMRGTTTNSQYLWNKAKEAALKTKFSSHIYAPEEQQGTMTFVFVLE